MGFFNDWRSHYTAGFAYGLLLRALSDTAAEKKIVNLYIWGWEREVAQHDPDLTPHQIEEARAWGDGASKARRLSVGLPTPPYPV